MNSGEDCPRYQSEVLVDENKSEMPETINGESGRADDFESIAPIESAITKSPPSLSPDASATSTPTPKGYGLKKWRRIRRELNKNATSSPTSAQILKRHLSMADPLKVQNESNKHRSDADAEGSLSASQPLDPDLVASGGFSVGAESDNSEDRSGRSTAGSGVRLRHGRGLGQRGQRGRGGGFDASKKFRERFEKENSQSSIESDLQSSNAGWGVKERERFGNGDGEPVDEAQACEGVGVGYYKENGRVKGSLKDDLDFDLKDGNVRSRNSHPHTDLNPFIESIVLLQAAQEALEIEIQKFEEMGREPILDESNGHLEGTEGSGSGAREAEFLELNQKIEHLEHRLEEASATLMAKESMVLELASTLQKTNMLSKETESIDLEGLARERIEAEIEYLITAGATQSWKAETGDRVALSEKQNSLAESQTQMMMNLREADTKADMLKEQAQELEAHCEELFGTGEVMKLQNRVCRSSLYCFIELVMLCFALWWFLMQLFPLSDGIVPT